jgi:hypothetical protein
MLTDKNVEFVGEVDDRAKQSFLGNQQLCCSPSTGLNRSGS